LHIIAELSPQRDDVSRFNVRVPSVLSSALKLRLIRVAALKSTPAICRFQGVYLPIAVRLNGWARRRRAGFQAGGRGQPAIRRGPFRGSKPAWSEERTRSPDPTRGWLGGLRRPARATGESSPLPSDLVDALEEEAEPRFPRPTGAHPLEVRVVLLPFRFKYSPSYPVPQARLADRRHSLPGGRATSGEVSGRRGQAHGAVSAAQAWLGVVLWNRCARWRHDLNRSM
jgi:hypothetical protein